MKHARWATMMVSMIGLTSCGYFDSRNAKKAETALIGLSAEQLKACAGIPNKKEKLATHTELFLYTGNKAAQTFSSVALIPVGEIATVLQQAAGGGGTNCTAVMRLDYDRVTEVHYTGDSDEVIGSDGVCAVIVRGCLRNPPGIYSARELPPTFQTEPAQAPFTASPNKNGTKPAIHR